MQDPGQERRKQLAVGAFRFLERVGVHVLPRHFYSSVADRAWLDRHPELWRHPTQIAGLPWEVDGQLRWLSTVCEPYLDEVRGFSFLPALAERGIPFRYGLIEAQVLHCVIRSLVPRRVVEVGSGASTAVMSDAASSNQTEGRGSTHIVSIDPYASERVRLLQGVEVMCQPAQAAPAGLFASLESGDLLFIDSTHALKTGSELGRLYLEIIPSLVPGVIVHIHDIYLPYLYSPLVLGDLWDWQETALLAGLLTGNPHFELLCCQSLLHDRAPDRLALVLPDYVPRRLADGLDSGAGDHYPSSTWLRSR
ncbi:MAG TPA: class I SAM-dependent methyltransferase [Acidimicrobiales bacterium]|nr:class I SAM-dependent methyltransferase [Acidimicrobiales bacterium]